MSSKFKSGLPETPKSSSKVSPAPRLSSIGRRLSDPKSKDSPNPPRLSLDSPNGPSLHRSPKPKLSPSPPLSHKQSPVSSKGSDLQSQLNLLRDELKKANEHIALLEIEKAKAVDELKEAQKVADGTNEKLRDALVAQKRAEENSEIERFRAIELEQAGIEASQRKEDEWQRELEAVRNQHAVDVAALLSTTRELQRVQHELASAIDAENQALSHADDATKIAEMHAEKNKVLSAEIAQIKHLLDSKLENEASEKSRMLLQLKDEIVILNRELERAKGFEEKLMERNVSIEHLSADLEATKLAESYACSLVEEWKNKAEQLQESLEEANELERSASESLDSVVKQMERSNGHLNDAKLEISVLKDKVSSLEMATEKRMWELKEARRRLAEVEEEYEGMERAADTLRSDLDALREEKARALSSEKVASSSVRSLSEEKARLIDELKISKEEEEKSKKAMESLASALHEVSTEARDAKEKLVCLQIESENWEAQMEDLRLVLKATKEKYEAMLHDAKGEMDHLASAVEQSSYEYETSKAEWEQKEFYLVDCLKQLEQEKHDLQIAKEGVDILLEKAEEKAHGAEGQEALLRGSLKEVEDEVVYLQGALGETQAESMKLNQIIFDKEKELQGLVRENEELRFKEAASLERIEELYKLLEEATLKIQPMENGDLLGSERGYGLLPKVAELSSEEKGHGGEEDVQMDALLQPEGPKRDSVLEINSSLKDEQPDQEGRAKAVRVNGEAKDEDGLAEKGEDSGGVKYKTWESCKIEKKDYERVEGSVEEEEEEEPESKAEGEENLEKTNGTNSSEYADDGGDSPSSKERNPKKKKALLQKFGSLLKKKKGASSSPKQKEKEKS